MSLPCPRVKYTIYGAGFNEEHEPNAPNAYEDDSIVREHHGHGFAVGRHPVENTWVLPIGPEREETLRDVVGNKLHELGVDWTEVVVLRIGAECEGGESDAVVYVPVRLTKRLDDENEREIGRLRRKVYPAVLGILERVGFKDVGVYIHPFGTC